MIRGASVRALGLGISLLLATPAAAVQLRGSVVGSGGAAAAGPGMRVGCTAGQTVVGRSTGSARIAHHGFWVSGAAPIVGVGDDPETPGHGVTSLAFGLASANPARSGMTFGVSLPAAGRVDIDVIDAQGRHVASLAGTTYEPGVHRIGWTGGGRGGTRVAPGVYFARLRVDGRAHGVRRIVLTP